MTPLASPQACISVMSSPAQNVSPAPWITSTFSVVECLDPVDRPDQLVAERDRERVSLLGPIERDAGDRAVLGVAQQFEVG